MAEIRCPNCGNENPEGQEFCDTPLTSQAITPPGETDESPPDQAPPQEGQPQERDADSEAGWLDVLHASEEPPSPEEPEIQDIEEEEQAKEKETDWLQRIRDLDIEEEEAPPPPREGDAFPDWMAEEEPEKAADSFSDEEAGLPDWLQPEAEDPDEEEEGEDRQDEVVEPDLEPPQEEPLTSPEQEGVELPHPPQKEEEEFPSWLKEEGAPSQEDPVPEDQPAAQPFQLDEEEDYDDLFDEELPSWLTAVDEEEEFETGEDISPGELPGWVEAMQPVVESSDTSGLPEDEEYIENYGPLAGIPSVLPAEPEIEQVDPDKKSEHMTELSVTKTQRDYAGLLKEVISDERKVEPVSEESRLPTQRILRWLIAVVLLLSVGASIVAGGGENSPPGSQNPDQDAGYARLYEQVDSLEQGETALVAFDYQPALAGELEAAAAGVVDHILDQEAYLALVSTQPTGPSLGEHFLSTTQTEREVRHGRHYINLGYIPGQAAGILGFSLSPREIIPIAFNGGNAWDSPPLREIDNLDDFSLILILTDDPTSARIWIEQIIPYTSKEKISMVVSAQAEPLVQPYFENSPQLIFGLVGGLEDGRAYEALAQSPNRASAYWFPLNVGIIVTVLTIFIGGLANGVLNLIRMRQNTNQGEEP